MSEALCQSARDLFADTLAAIDVQRVMQSAIRLQGAHLSVAAESFDLDQFAQITVIAVGKAAPGMALTVQQILGERITRGLVVTYAEVDGLSAQWESVSAAHPVPDAGSVRGAVRALELVAAADARDSLILFLVSGGASAMLESPLDPAVPLDDLRRAYSILVTCGAVIAEINVVRRWMSAVKGGRLAAAAPAATQLSLFISDVNAGDLATIASGPTLPDPSTRAEFEAILERYDLRASLPESILGMFNPASNRGELAMPERAFSSLLMSDRMAIAASTELAQVRFDVVAAECWDELPVADLAQRMVSRLRELMIEHPGRSVCFLSAGESICPVRGDGRGGRNQELALRVAPLLASFDDVAFLAAGTDGIDGNSTAAGAVVDESTMARGIAAGLAADTSLAGSDSFTYLDQLGATVVTGPTGNNVRDLWLAIART